MRKHKKLVISSLAVLALALLLHFVPFDSRTGYLNRGLANVCIGYTQPTNYTYRWISGGVNAWDNQLSYLKEGKITQSNPTCAEPAHVRLYLL